jgi:hypothetical protein
VTEAAKLCKVFLVKEVDFLELAIQSLFLKKTGGSV